MRTNAEWGDSGRPPLRTLIATTLLVFALVGGVTACGSSGDDEDATTTTSAPAETTTTTVSADDEEAGTGNEDLDTYCESVSDLAAEFEASGSVDPEAYSGLLVTSEAIAEDATIQGDEELSAAAEECLTAFGEIPADTNSPEAVTSSLCDQAEELVNGFDQVATPDEYVALDEQATALGEAVASAVEQFPDQQETLSTCTDAVRVASDEAASRFPVDTPTD